MEQNDEKQQLMMRTNWAFCITREYLFFLIIWTTLGVIIAILELSSI